MVSPEYLEELALLQDRIAPFSTNVALNIIEEELGVPVESIFSEISPQPVAAASLGQVRDYIREIGPVLQLLSSLHYLWCAI